MSLRPALLVALLASAIALPARADSLPDPTAADLPRAVCTHRVTDPAGDAFISPTTTYDPQLSVDPADVVSVTMRLTPDALQAFMELKGTVPAPADMPYGYGYHYEVDFTYGGFAFVGAALAYRTDQSSVVIKSSYTQFTAKGTNVPTAKEYLSPAWGQHFVVWNAPRADVEKITGPLTDGGTFTAIVGETRAEPETVKGVLLDTTSPSPPPPDLPPPVQADDDYCFGPPPAALSALAATHVQYGDVATYTTRLTTEKGDPLAGRKVDFTIAGDSTPRSATTDANGIAALTYVPPQAAGTYAVSASFAGETDNGKATVSGGSLVVTAEKTVTSVARVGTSHTVQDTLVDDDHHAVAGQPIAWYVGSHKVATGTTDRQGHCRYAAKAGTKVQARYAGQSGKYAAASSKVVTA